MYTMYTIHSVIDLLPYKRKKGRKKERKDEWIVRERTKKGRKESTKKGRKVRKEPRRVGR